MGKHAMTAIPRFVRAMSKVRAGAGAKQELSRSEAGGTVVSDTASVGYLPVLLVLVLDNHQRAVSRASGIRSFRKLVGLVRTRSLLADLLLPLAPAIQTPRLVDRHILTHLSAVGGRFTIGVAAAFQQLLSELLRLLELSCRSRKPQENMVSSSADANGTATNWDELARASKCKNPMPPWFDAHTVLVLLEVWGLTIHSDDWQFIETAGVVHAISCVASVPFAVGGHFTVESGAGGDKCNDPVRDDEGGSRTGRATRPQEKAAPADQRCRPLATCREAAWTLFRALVIQLHGSTTSLTEKVPLQLRCTIEVLRAELVKCVMKAKSSNYSATNGDLERGGRRGGGEGRLCRNRTPSQAILEFAPPLIRGFPDSPPHGQGTAVGKVYGAGASHKRRCQELVSGPRRLMNMEDGLVFPAEHVLSNPRGSDFSITFWLLLAQDRTGHHRTVLARGHGSERWPVVLLRNTDNRLEVSVARGSLNFFCSSLMLISSEE